MLRKTKEFKDFASFVTDSGGQVRTLSPRARPNEKKERKRSHQRSASLRNRRSNSTAANNQQSAGTMQRKTKLMNANLILVDELNPAKIDTEDEDEVQDGWVPNDAYALAHGVRKQFGNELTPDLINDMLRDLNKIWREREKKQLTRLKTAHANELNNLRRKLTHRTPLDEVVSKKNMACLKKQVMQLTEELDQTRGKLPKDDKMPPGVDLIEQTLVLVS